MMTKRAVAWELTFAALALAAAAPIWLVKHPPIQDLPQHLAAIRVLHDYSDPAFGFQQYFHIHVGRTQYLTYYVLTHLLAYPLGVFAANKVVFTATILGLPYSLRALLGALGRDQRIALFALPLAWNAHLVLGFVNFAAALPLMLFGIALAVRLRFDWDPRRAIALAVVALATFYTHVVPFGFLALGVTLVALGGEPKLMGQRLAPLLPATLGMLAWAVKSPAAKAVFGASQLSEASVSPEYHSFSRSLQDLGLWLFDVLKSEIDEQLLVVWGLLLVVALVLGVGGGPPAAERDEDDALRAALVRRLALLGPLAFVAYFIAPAAYDWVWPINARFPVIGVAFLLLAWPALPARAAWPVYAAVGLVSALFFREVAVAFQRSEREERADADAAIASIPMGRRVAGLIWDRESRFVRWSPYLHGAAMYQASRGGAVMFTFAEYPQSPFSFRSDNRPPKVPRRWEWAPFFVRPVPDLDWFEYVLTRGDTDRMKAYSDSFELSYDGSRWKVWRRRDPAKAFDAPEPTFRLLNDAPEVTPPADSSCHAIAASGKTGTIQDAVRSTILRAKRSGRCGDVSGSGRACTLELRAHDFDFAVDFRVENDAIPPESLSCRGRAPQPPM
jgi:hypothetical protein